MKFICNLNLEKDIKLFDFITPNLFYSNSDIGNSFIDVLKKTEMIFIVYERIWVDQNTLEFELLMGRLVIKKNERKVLRNIQI